MQAATAVTVANRTLQSNRGERDRYTDPAELFSKLTVAECEQVAERFIDVLYRHRHARRARLSGDQAAVLLHQIYLDAQQWVRGRDV